MSTADTPNKPTPSSPRTSRELVRDRLATTDASGNRVYLYPADYKGAFRTLRTQVQAVLILFFLLLPWLRIDGHPAVLLNIPDRKFAVFGIQFWAHDAPMLFFVFGGVAIALLFITAIWGRLWCGWACPQTVFIDGVFRRIERLIEGDGFTRRKRDQGPMTADKVWRKIAKWGLFVLATLIITHSFLAYFVGTEKLLNMVTRPPFENMTSFLVMAVCSVIILFDFGWFREQFCTIACPYGRFQSVTMDSRSLIVGYDAARGEPRSGSASLMGPAGAGPASAVATAPGVAAAPASAKKGDCVNCYRCVQVCPTGVDIRRGVQLECIACTACVDACDEVMTRLGKPTGLIRYTSEVELAGQPRKLGIRPLLYGMALSAIFIGLVITLDTRKMIEWTFIRAINTPYQVTTHPVSGKEEIVNHFRVDLANQSFNPMKIVITAPEEYADRITVVSADLPMKLEPGTQRRANLFIRFPKELLTHGAARLPLEIEAKQSPAPSRGPIGVHYRQELPFVGPFN